MVSVHLWQSLQEWIFSLWPHMKPCWRIYHNVLPQETCLRTLTSWSDWFQRKIIFPFRGKYLSCRKFLSLSKLLYSPCSFSSMSSEERMQCRFKSTIRLCGPFWQERETTNQPWKMSMWCYCPLRYWTRHGLGEHDTRLPNVLKQTHWRHVLGSSEG